MDKTLEVVLVATVLVVASVVVISMLQSQSNSFNQFAGEQESSASCGIAQSKAERQCPDKSAVDDLLAEYGGQCDWASGSPAPTCTSFCGTTCNP
jgi:hypothetical protein